MSEAAAVRPTLWRVAAAFLRRDLAVALSYRISFALQVAGMALALASLVYFARFIGPAPAGGDGVARYGGAGYVGFWIVGLAVADLFHAMTSALPARIRQAQVEGTLEAMLATPAPAGLVVVAAGLGDVLVALVRLAVYLVAGALVMGVTFGPVHLGSLLLSSALSLLAFAALGLFGGAITMSLRRSDPVTTLAALASVLIGGVLYPVDVLPPLLAAAAYALPSAPALEAVRLALFTGAPPAALGRELLALGAFTVVVGPLGALWFARALRRAREDGSLGQY